MSHYNHATLDLQIEYHRRPCFLILDEHFSTIPIEQLPRFVLPVHRQMFYRIPSLTYLTYDLKSIIPLNINNLYYVLNPKAEQDYDKNLISKFVNNK